MKLLNASSHTSARSRKAIPVVCLVAGLLAAMTTSALGAGATPRPLANMSLEATPGGKPIRLADYRGKVLLIALLSTSCGECAESVAVLNNIQREYAPKGVQIVGAAVDEGAVTTVRSFLDRYKPAFPFGLLTEDATRKLADFTKTDRPFVPIFLFVDQKGTITNQFFGDSAFFKEENKSARGLLDIMLRR